MYWIRNDVSLFPYLWYIIKYSKKVSRYEEFQGCKGNQDIFNKVSYFIIIIIEYWGKMVNFLRGIEVEARKMFFRSCHEPGTKKKCWVLMRNQASDLQIPRSDVLSPSLLFIFDKLTICACNSGLYWTLQPRFNGCLLLR